MLRDVELLSELKEVHALVSSKAGAEEAREAKWSNNKINIFYFNAFMYSDITPYMLSLFL